MTITLRPKKLAIFLTAFAFLLVLIHSIALAIYFYVDDPDVFDFVRLIDLDYEGNIPTLFSALLFLSNGCLFYLLYRATKENKQPYALYWLGLALVFTFLGFDEGTRLHEEIGDLTEHLVEAKGLLYFPWVIPYSIAFVIAVSVYFRFYLTLDRRLQLRLLACAVVFLSGAVGLEIFSAREAETSGTSSLSYSILYTIEESLEMAGLILLFHTLTDKLRVENDVITLKLR
ncbi:MAG: peptidase M48 Ste24p [Gammaproteobacteria bacterium]|nr:peptidase M48 Ste24p [Gammaproteobacteria bacterium]